MNEILCGWLWTLAAREQLGQGTVVLLLCKTNHWKASPPQGPWLHVCGPSGMGREGGQHLLLPMGEPVFCLAWTRLCSKRFYSQLGLWWIIPVSRWLFWWIVIKMTACITCWSPWVTASPNAKSKVVIEVTHRAVLSTHIVSCNSGPDNRNRHSVVTMLGSLGTPLYLLHSSTKGHRRLKSICCLGVREVWAQ